MVVSVLANKSSPLSEADITLHATAAVEPNLPEFYKLIPVAMQVE